MGKSAGVDSIPAGLVQVGGEAMIDILTTICNKIWRTGEWPAAWARSLVSHSQGGWATCGCAGPAGPSALSAILVRSCWGSSWADSGRGRGGGDHCRRAGGFQSRKEHHRTNIQSQDLRREIPAASAESLPCLRGLQGGLWRGVARGLVGNCGEIQHQRQHHTGY